MKEILFCEKRDRKLYVRTNVLTDVDIPPKQDVISPQKTKFAIPLSKIYSGDTIIVRSINSNKVEYIGIVETVASKDYTEVSCTPLISLFDNDFVLDQLHRTVRKGRYNELGVWYQLFETEDIGVEVAEWLSTQIKRAFVYDADEESPSFNAYNFDELQGFPFVIENKIPSVVFYKGALESSNLYEAYVNLFIETGVYVEFSELVFEENVIAGIKCNVRCNRFETPYYLRWDNPSIQSVLVVDDTFASYNKIIATEEMEEGATGTPQRYYFYLLNNNEITTDATDERRIKQVRSKEISFSLAENAETEEGMTEEEIKQSRAESLILAVYNELQAPEYNVRIEIEMIDNPNLTMYRKVHFDNDGVVYESNITAIERLSDAQVKVTLGALRNSLTDFKKKVEEI